jgi:hypothetical protein
MQTCALKTLLKIRTALSIRRKRLLKSHKVEKVEILDQDVQTPKFLTQIRYNACSCF